MHTPISYFSELTDPRVERSKEHLMEDYCLHHHCRSHLWSRNTE
jgi:hypothetical protein